ncbi:MAG TPA: hypothetical protein VMT85_25050, partial [Thermoanaerobaculia bacterium]|nr:hypothetical protein [Thermoanaerobaculia bacterium]
LSAEDAVTPAVRTGRKSAREAEKEARRQAKREEEALRREERRVEQGRAARLVASAEPEATELENDDDDEAAAKPEDLVLEPGAERERPFSPALSDPPPRPAAESQVAPAARPPDPPSLARLLPNPDLLPAGACPECGPDEWSVATESVAAMAGSCRSSAIEPVVGRLASALGEHLEGPLAAYAGALWSNDGNDALRLLPDALEQELRALLEPVAGEGTSCPLVAVVLPENARYVGFRYAAGERSGMAECPPGQGCLIGEAAWQGNPEILEAGAVKLVWARFENASAQRQRMPRLTVYFEPARTWLPPSR